MTLLRVPEETHVRARLVGFEYYQNKIPQACALCDQPINTLDMAYKIPAGDRYVDFWCARCIETKLPSILAEAEKNGTPPKFR